MALSSRQQLVDYCLRRLGFPVIEINVDEDQISDRIDDALQMYQEYHFDGVEKTFFKHEITGSKLKLNLPVVTNFTKGETITGGTSGATAKVFSTDGQFITVETKSETDFTAGETITGSESGSTASVAATDHYTAGDIENGWIPISNGVIGITKVFNIGNKNQNSGGEYMFDIEYQFRLNDMYNLLGADMTYYSMVQSHLTTLEKLLVTDRQIRWNRKTNRLYIDTDWDKTFDPGKFLLVEGYAILDPETYTEVYDDMFLKKYATALIKRQWGENMKKFGGIQLPGGVILNGGEIFQEAVQEITQIEQEMSLKYELPPTFMVG